MTKKKQNNTRLPSKVDGNLITDKNAIAEGFNHFFVSIVHVKTISEKLSQSNRLYLANDSNHRR